MEINDRPKSVDNAIKSLRGWREEDYRYFLNFFIENNCEKIQLYLTPLEIEENLNNYDFQQLKSVTIKLLQNIKIGQGIKLPSVYEEK